MYTKLAVGVVALLCSGGIASATAVVSRDTADSSITAVCNEIGSAISSASEVFFPSDSNYAADIYHYSASSTQQATCSVEPGTTQDVGTILQILGASRTPFAVKGGGHAMNPNFSSTTGVQIAMSRFSDVVYDASSGTADVGAGLIWDDVYAALEPFNRSAVGGRVFGIGVAGFILGGGYSWLTNQFGLAIDNVEAYELVLPNATTISVTSTSYPDLFFGLKGGWNNFGIVTKFTLKTYPQGPVWGGTISLGADSLDAFTTAIVKFVTEVTDPKAAAITSYGFALGEASGSIQLFYDGPTPPAGIFDDFLALPSTSADVSTRSLLSLVDSTPINGTAGLRGVYQVVSVTNISASILEATLNETRSVGQQLATAVPESLISYAVEPFLPSLFTHGPPSAYPPSRDRAIFPINGFTAWESPDDDAFMESMIRNSSERLTQAALDEGQDIADVSLYGNYALFGTPLSRILGDNVPKVAALQKLYDPEGVMLLAGGWKF